MTMPKTFDKAVEILRAEPLPEDAEEQLEKLLGETPAEFEEQFLDFFEALAVKENANA